MKNIPKIEEDVLQMVSYKVRMQKFRRMKGEINKENRTKRMN